jgi:hypothetical protein
MDAKRFLERYQRSIEALPVFSHETYRGLDLDQRRVFITLLPQAAAFRHRHPELSIPDLVEEVKCYCVGEIGKQMKNEK